MAIYVDIIANETTARTSETQMLAGNTATAGKYYPKFKGKLVKVRIKCTPQAATSLCQAGYVKLIQEDWDPNTIIFAFNGFGLATAPQAVRGNVLDTAFLVDLVVAPDKPIHTLLFENDSPLTPRIRVEGTLTNAAA